MVLRCSYRGAVLRSLAGLLATVFSISLTAAITSPSFAADNDAAADAVKRKIESSIGGAIRLADHTAIQAFYAGREWRPIWVDATGPTRAGQLAANELRRAPDWGLSESDFKLPAFDVPRIDGQWTSEQTAAVDVEITTAILEYAHQARGGRIPEPDRQLSTYLDRRPRLIDPAFVLVMVLPSASPDAILRSFHPQHDQFRKLQAVFSKLRSASGSDAVPEIPEEGTLLAPGMRHDDVPTLRSRLKVAAAEDANLYDEVLALAVKEFQSSAGLRNDGLVGKRTRKALNKKPDINLATLRANMEQWRWMPEDLGITHLFVNVPEFELRLVADGKIAHEERVITGRSETQTPIFSKEMSQIVLRPTWKMPDSIKLEKLLSAKRRGRSLEDQGYIVKKGRRTVDSTDVDWSKANLSHYEIYQPSGDGNALGDVKFLFPNKHSVYLHDTPMKSLFEAEARLFSHGCIRLRKPLTLAQILLDRDRGEGRFDVKELASDGPEVNSIALERPMPIHVGYFTAWADGDSNVRTFGDPYGHEERITLALDGKWSEIDKGADHLAAVDTAPLTGKPSKTPSQTGVAQPVRASAVSASAARVARPKPVRVAAAKPDTDDEPAPVRKAAAPRPFAPPLGVTKVIAAPQPKPAKASQIAKLFKVSAKSSKHRSDGGVGDIMRNALMH